MTKHDLKRQRDALWLTHYKLKRLSPNEVDTQVFLRAHFGRVKSKQKPKP